MNNKHLFFFIFIFFSIHISHAGTTEFKAITTPKTIEPLTFYEATKKLKWEFGAVAGGAIYLGLKTWNWGSRNSFKFNNEGWFGTNTGSAGSDKLGHLYSSYLINEFFTKSLMQKTDNKLDAAKWSALFSTSIMLMVEVFDGYSVDHGFSYEDLISNSVGIGISYLKNTVPNLDEKLDLRVEYLPTYAPHNKHPVTDYSGYKYIASLRLAGFEKLKKTPLKYLELQVGYHAEGFKHNENRYYDAKMSEVYFGISLNLTELLFNPIRKHTSSPLVDYVDTFTRYYQIPGTYVSTPIHRRTIQY